MRLLKPFMHSKPDLVRHRISPEKPAAEWSSDSHQSTNQVARQTRLQKAQAKGSGNSNSTAVFARL